VQEGEGGEGIAIGSVKRKQFSVVLNGHSLVFGLQEELEQLLLAVATQCQAVICCRVTPLQKAKVVDLVKRYKKVVTLSVGDGANDVSMIKTAHIGVGISGQEGLQAVLASDYSVAQFRFLERLLLVHGRLSYFRMCKFLRYFFYKNFAYTFCQLWYAFVCGFSAQTVFGSFYISSYNLFYTALPVLFLGAFDQDVSEEMSLRFPALYTPGLQNRWFDGRQFLRSAGHGFLTSFTLFCVVFGHYFNALEQKGQTLSDFYTFGSVLSLVLITVVTGQICLDTQYWTVFSYITIFGSLFITYFFTVMANILYKTNYSGTVLNAFGDPGYWLCSLLSVVMTMVPVLCWRFWRADTHPTLTEHVRFKMLHERDVPKTKAKRKLVRRASTRRAGYRPSFRSGYAFSHQEGFARLITEGKLLATPNMQ